MPTAGKGDGNNTGSGMKQTANMTGPSPSQTLKTQKTEKLPPGQVVGNILTEEKETDVMKSQLAINHPFAPNEFA